MILVPELAKALNGEPFRYIPVGKEFAVQVEAVPNQAFFHYMNIFNYSELWGLPHGGGWANELPWVLEFLSSMKLVKSEIEAWHHRKAMARMKGSS